MKLKNAVYVASLFLCFLIVFLSSDNKRDVDFGRDTHLTRVVSVSNGTIVVGLPTGHKVDQRVEQIAGWLLRLQQNPLLATRFPFVHRVLFDVDVELHLEFPDVSTSSDIREQSFPTMHHTTIHSSTHGKYRIRFWHMSEFYRAFVLVCRQMANGTGNLASESASRHLSEHTAENTQGMIFPNIVTTSYSYLWRKSFKEVRFFIFEKN